MNKKGQAGIIFVLLIPVFMIIAAIIIDTSINIYSEKKIKNVTTNIMETLLEKEPDEEEYKRIATRIYEANKIDVDYLTVKINDNKIEIYNTTLSYSFLGSMIGREKNQTVVEAQGYKDESGNVIVRFKGDSDEF